MKKNNKSYQKVYFNSDCIVDFTRQTINENNVASDNMFFDTELKQKEKFLHIIQRKNQLEVNNHGR